MFDLDGMKQALSYLDNYWNQKDTRERPENFQVLFGGQTKVQDRPITDNDRPRFHGSADQILLDIEELAEAGITFGGVGFEGTTYSEYMENMERFAIEVMPKAKKIGPGPPY